MRLLPAALLTLSLSACASPVPPNAKTGGPLPPMREPCSADAAQSLIGRKASAEVIEQARIAARAEVARVLKPGQMVTMEYRAGRLNVDVDEAGVITGVRCG
jgi:hypothetical protein